MTRRIGALWLAAVLLAGVLCGCTPERPPEDPPVTEDPAKLETPVAREGAIDPVSGNTGHPVLRPDPNLIIRINMKSYPIHLKIIFFQGM